MAEILNGAAPRKDTIGRLQDIPVDLGKPLVFQAGLARDLEPGDNLVFGPTEVQVKTGAEVGAKEVTVSKGRVVLASKGDSVYLETIVVGSVDDNYEVGYGNRIRWVGDPPSACCALQAGDILSLSRVGRGRRYIVKADAAVGTPFVEVELGAGPLAKRGARLFRAGKLNVRLREGGRVYASYESQPIREIGRLTADFFPQDRHLVLEEPAQGVAEGIACKPGRSGSTYAASIPTVRRVSRWPRRCCRWIGGTSMRASISTRSTAGRSAGWRAI